MTRSRPGHINLELGDQRKARLDAFCAAQGVTISDAVRHAIDRHLASPPVPASSLPLPMSPPPPVTATGAGAEKRRKKA